MDEVELFFSLLLGASIIVIVYKLAQRTGGGGGGGGGPLRPAGSLPRSWSNSEGGVIVDRYSTVEQVHRVKLPATQTQVARREPWHTGQSPGSSARYRERHRDRETERDSDRGREGGAAGLERAGESASNDTSTWLVLGRYRRVCALPVPSPLPIPTTAAPTAALFGADK